MKTGKRTSQVISIGLDGGTFDLMDPWLREGHLPNIERLVREGTRATLNSVILPFTPQAWGSFMTGMNPGNHGVFGFKEKSASNYSFQLVNNRSIKSKTLWSYLSEQGRRVILVNIPMTFPPEEVNGVIIAGMDAPGVDSDFTFPASIKAEVLDVVKDYTIHLHVGAGYLDSDKKRREAAVELINMVEGREQLILHLMEKYPWDFFAVNFSSIDQVQHHFWKYIGGDNEFSDVVLRVYKRVDEAIGKIRARLTPETTLFMMSDHGSGPATPYVIFIDEWLRENGFLAFKSSFSVRRVMSTLVNFALSALSQKSSSQFKDLLMRWFPGLRAKSQGYVRRSLIDWSRTAAYSGEHPSTVRINLKGRDAFGTVDPGDYERVRDELIGKLELLKHPETGECLIERVYRREEIYSGDYLNVAPDLIIHPKDFAHQVRGGPYPGRHYGRVVSEKSSREFYVNGVHRLNGIFLAVGEGVRANYIAAPLSIIDLFATILYSLGMKVPRAVDSKVAVEVFEEDHLANQPVCYCDHPMKRGVAASWDGINYEEDDSKIVEQALRELGYID